MAQVKGALSRENDMPSVVCDRSETLSSCKDRAEIAMSDLRRIQSLFAVNHGSWRMTSKAPGCPSGDGTHTAWKTSHRGSWVAVTVGRSCAWFG